MFTSNDWICYSVMRHVCLQLCWCWWTFLFQQLAQSLRGRWSIFSTTRAARSTSSWLRSICRSQSASRCSSTLPGTRTCATSPSSVSCRSVLCVFYRFQWRACSDHHPVDGIMQWCPTEMRSRFLSSAFGLGQLSTWWSRCAPMSCWTFRSMCGGGDRW